MATKPGASIPLVRGTEEYNNDGQKVNQNYLHITNIRPSEVPYLNSYRDTFSNVGMPSDAGRTAWITRPAVSRCLGGEPVLNENGTIDETNVSNFVVTDTICCGGDRFQMLDLPSNSSVCSDRVHITKQCDVSYRSGCEDIYYDCCKKSEFVQLTEKPFPMKSCTYKKFTKTQGPIGKPKYKTCDGVLRVDKIGNYLFYSVYDSSGNIVANVGDWVYVSSETGPFFANAGFLNQVTGSNASYSCGGGGQGTSNLVVSSPRPDIVPITDSLNQSAIGNGGDISEILDTFFNQATNQDDAVCAFYEYPNVCVDVYEEVGDTFAFATADGVYTYAGSDCETGSGEFILIPNSTPSIANTTDNITDCSGGVEITSVFDYYGQLGYISGGSIIINSPGSFLAQNVFDSQGYTDAIPVNDLLVFVGPNSAGALTNSSSGAQLSPIFNEQGSGIGYFNQGSYANNLEDFYFVSSGGHIYQLDFSASLVENTGQYVFKPIMNDIDLYIRHTLRSLDRRKGDYVYIDADEDNLKLYIGSEGDNYTQIYYLDNHSGYWHDDKICNARIIGEGCGCLIGTSGQYAFGGENAIEEVTTMISGITDVSIANRKYFEFLRIVIGYNSDITDKTVLKVKIYDDGCLVKDECYPLSNFQYVRDLTNQKLMDDKQDLFNNGFVIKRPGKPPKKVACFADEMKAFCSYKPKCRDLLNECDDIDADVSCGDSVKDVDILKVAPFASLHFPIMCHGSVMKRELVSHGGDRLEYLGAYGEMYYTNKQINNVYEPYFDDKNGNT